LNEIMFSSGKVLTRWSTLFISLPQGRDAFDRQGLAVVMSEFHQKLKRMGVVAAEPKTAQRLQLQHTDDPALGPFLERAAGSLELLLIILPEANTPIYKRIKTLADKTYGIQTVCCVGSKLAKVTGRDQYLANVSLKFNLKLGGVNQTVESKSLGIVSQNRTMVVGIDVTHPSPGSSSHAPSVSAMVASIDEQRGQ
jgi:eukaryotic translation initiation factor 2C